MSMIVETSSHYGVLHVRATGEFTLASARSTFLEVVDALVKLQVEKVLFDGRALGGEPTFIERFYYGEFAADTVLHAQAKLTHGRSPQFAYLLVDPVLDPQRLGETVAINRGMNVKAFDSVHDAAEWLGVTEIATDGS